uniref:PDZ domain-containing protein n=1 Tax=Globisporangium ultimum (strain ATCC 200006 / CBS 805.95 / DAOM BR144) TaxID=431595 RepID=K3WEN1_GLOUD
MSRKNFSSLSHFASKAGIGSGSSSSASSSAPTSAAAPMSNGNTGGVNSVPGKNGYSGGGGYSSASAGSAPKRPTWADKIREKLPELGEHEYEVLWERGVLGVIFLESEKDGIPYVSKATESCISPAVSAGDVLKYVNTVRSSDHSFSDFFKILATMKKPVLLRFERPSQALSTTSSDEDSPLDQRSSSAIGMESDRSLQDDLAPKVLRSNSVPQSEKSKPSRSAFWRTVSSKEYAQDPVPAPVPAPAQSPPAQQVVTLAPPKTKISPRDNGYGTNALHSGVEYYEYEVYWETGSLGLFFGEDRLTSLPVVTRSTPGANPIVQQMVAVNDTLVSANGVQSREYSFEAFFGRLQQMKKPVRLIFKRKVDPSPAHIPARGRKPSVTVDELTSPSEDGSLARRVSTPPPPIVEEEEVATRISQARINEARTPPDSPIRARESRRLQKSELDAVLRGAKPASPNTRDAAPGSSTYSESYQHRTAASSPTLNLARDTAAIMSSASESQQFRGSALSPHFASRESVKITSPVPDPQPKRNPTLSPRNLAQDSAAIMGNQQAQQSPERPSSVVQEAPVSPVLPEQAMARSSSQNAMEYFDLFPSSTVPDSQKAQNVSPSNKAAQRDSVSTAAVVQDVPAKRSSVSSSSPESETSVLANARMPELDGPVFVLGRSPPSSPRRASQCNSEKDVKSELSLAKAPSRRSSGEETAVEYNAQSRKNASEESQSIWEMAAQEESMDDTQPVTESHQASDPADTGIVADGVGYPQDSAAELVVAEAVEEPVVGVALGIIAEVEVGIVVDASEAEGNLIMGGEPGLVLPVLPPEDTMVVLDDHSPQLGDLMSNQGAVNEKTELEADDGLDKSELADMDPDAMDAIDQAPDITADIDGNDVMPQVSKIKGGTHSPFKNQRATVNANLAKYKRKAKNSRAVVKLPALTEGDALTVPLVAPLAVNTTVQVRGRSKPKPSMLETPDSTTYLVKWKESRSIGLQLKEVRFAKGVYPLVTDVCQEPCCEMLKHVCVGDIIVEINGRNTSLMGVKKTVNFLKTCTKTTLLKLRHGPAFVSQRVSAHV